MILRNKVTFDLSCDGSSIIKSGNLRVSYAYIFIDIDINFFEGFNLNSRFFGVSILILFIMPSSFVKNDFTIVFIFFIPFL